MGRASGAAPGNVRFSRGEEQPSAPRLLPGQQPVALLVALAATSPALLDLRGGRKQQFVYVQCGEGRDRLLKYVYIYKG